MKSLGIRWKVDGEQVRPSNWADDIYCEIDESSDEMSDDVVEHVVSPEDIELGIGAAVEGSLNEIVGHKVEG